MHLSINITHLDDEINSVYKIISKYSIFSIWPMMSILFHFQVGQE